MKLDFEKYFEDAKLGYYRIMVIIQGDNALDNTIQLVQQYLEKNKESKIAYAFHPWINGSKNRLNQFKEKIGKIVDIDYSSSEKYLGETFNVVILDAIDDFRPNYISRLTDLASGGGLIVLYSNDISRGKLYKESITRDGKVKDLFEERFLSLAKQHRGIAVIENQEVFFKPFNSSESNKPLKGKNSAKISKAIYSLCVSNDQVKLIEEFSNFFNLRGKRIFSVTAPRGRGKSAGVGLALAEFIKKRRDPITVYITSPSYFSSYSILDFLLKGLDALGIRYRRVISKEGKIMKVTAGEAIVRWTSPDLAKDANADMLIVDEAGSLGVEYLENYVSKWEKVALITTVYGYEGSNKAFIKFLDSLNQSNLQRLKLTYPIRYAKGDPVEKFINDVMLFEVEPSYSVQDSVSEIRQEDLFSNEKLLKEVYGVLVTAHYRNSPDDLMFLGDMPNQRIFAYGSSAVAQVLEEGNLAYEKIHEIYEGKELEGNLIPERIVKYARLKEFGLFKGLRVMRIAVSPSLQGRGYGSKLLQHIEEVALSEGYDWIGSSFLGDVKVLSFWLKNGFIPVYMASKKNEGLGGYSIIVIKPLNKQIEQLAKNLYSLLKDKILRTSHQVYFNINPIILLKILSCCKIEKKFEIPESYRDKILAYVNGILPYNSVAEAVHSILVKYFYLLPIHLDDIELGVLIARCLQGKSWYHLSIILGINQSKAEKILKDALGKLMQIDI
ncbi:tRNA(Met) cytidine acetyltransferase [Candidatus Acidianus copahuensis]|uniref:tRNA(Met) cytidine acetyltransferase TmcA n=1 Tax=Candidatus Acidianus copahuensis TaxID=1160895 RepID=A0A031LLV5_9CREN|nr:GNAT family N-acetyltransferase [Candidatus Acidianus copahuensis]EZQ03197.1 tRNA(Met) cytidine acetyltransferase [Candidatus Acidianus copahuensis]